MGKRAKLQRFDVGGGKNLALQQPEQPKYQAELADKPVEIFVGQQKEINNGENRAVVAIETVRGARGEMAYEYEEKAFMSVDCLLRPVSKAGSGGLPRYANAMSGCQTHSPKSSQPPVQYGGKTLYNNAINVSYLDPLVNPSFNHYGQQEGHDFDVVARGNTPPTSHLGRMVAEDNGESPYSSDYRFLALRGPLVLQSWGYDLDGKPVPNKSDSEENASAGVFTNTGLQDEFLDGWLKKSNTWPVAPVDLRLDRARGVWVCPPSYKLVVGVLSGDLSPYGSTIAFLKEGQTLYDNEGNSVPYNYKSEDAPYFTVYDKTGLGGSSGSEIIAYYEPDKCEYYSLTSGSGVKQVVKFQLLEDMPYGASTASGVEVICTGGAWQTGEKTFTLHNGGDGNKLPLDSKWGPALEGWQGWAVASECSGTYEILSLESFAKYINFSLTSPLSSSPQTANVSESWDGKDVFSEDVVVKVLAGPGLETSCYPNGLNGTASLDPSFSSDNARELVYRIIENDDDLYIAGLGGDCSDSYPVSGVARRLVFGSGLNVYDFATMPEEAMNEDFGPCQFYITSNFKVYNTDDCLNASGNESGVDYSTPKNTFSLAFGKGLKAFQGDDPCATNIGLDITVKKGTATGECDDESETKSGVSTLNFGKGLAVYSNDEKDCESYIHLALDVENRPDLCYDAGKLVNPTHISQIAVGKGLAVITENGDACDEEAQIVLDMTIGGVEHKAGFEAGSGITGVEQEESCLIKLHSYVTAGDAHLDSNLVASARGQHINFGRGLRVYDDSPDDNRFTVGLAFDVGSSPYCAGDIQQAVIAPNVNAITFGDGFKIGHLGETSEAQVALNLTVGGEDGVSNISLGCGLKSEKPSENSCSTKLYLYMDVNSLKVSGLSFNESCFEVQSTSGSGECDIAEISLKKEGFGGSHEIVTDVYCDPSGGLVVTKKNLIWYACGAISGVQ